MLKNFNKNYRNISIFTSISYHSVFKRPPFLFFQHNQQCDTLLSIVPCTHKLKAGIAYCTVASSADISIVLLLIIVVILYDVKVIFGSVVDGCSSDRMNSQGKTKRWFLVGQPVIVNAD
jgi:hypothetical protein